MPDLVQDNAAHNLFNGLIGLGTRLKQLDLKHAANLLQAFLAVIGDIATSNWALLPGHLKQLIAVIMDQVPAEHVQAVMAMADTMTLDTPEDSGDLA